MYDAYWNGVFDVRWEGAPLGQEALRLVLSLRKRGYAERTCRDYGHAVIHLGRVLVEGGAGGIPDDAVVERFLRDHLPVCCCYRSQQAGRRGEAARRGLAHLLAMLREEGALPVVRPDEPPFGDLIEGYCRFLRRDRGLAETTVVNYRRYLRDFLVSCGSAVHPEDSGVPVPRRRARFQPRAWGVSWAHGVEPPGDIALGVLLLARPAGLWGCALGRCGAVATAISPRRCSVRPVVGPSAGLVERRREWPRSPAQLRHAPPHRHLRAARVRGPGLAPAGHRLGARPDLDLFAQDGPAARAAADASCRRRCVELPHGGTSFFLPRRGLPVQGATAWAPAEQDQSLVGAPARQSRHRGAPPRCSRLASLPRGPPAAQRRDAQEHR